jgi:tetratricopeptide (TPR) repeat protein
MSDYDENEDAFDENKINEEIASPDKRVRADAIERLAQKTFFEGNPEKSLVYLATVADLRSELEDHSGLMWTYNQMGYVESERAHFKEALDYYKQMIDQARKAMHTKGEIDGLSGCASMCRRMKRYNEAADFLKDAVALGIETDYRMLGHLKADLARMLRKSGELEAAEQLLREAQETFMQNGFENIVPRVENELASTLFDEANVELSLAKATEGLSPRQV